MNRREELFHRLKYREFFPRKDVLDLLIVERNQALDEAIFLLRSHGLPDATDLIKQLRALTPAERADAAHL